MSLILDLIFPKKCYGCGKTGEYICPDCQSKLRILTTTPPQSGFDGGLSLFKYHSFLQTAITDLKYNFISDNVTCLSDLIAKTLKTNFPNLVNYWQQNNFIITSVPLHSYRQNWRGFNQSTVLADKLSRKISLNFTNQIIYRHQFSQIQAKLKHTQDRIKNVNQIFSLQPNSKHYSNQNFIIFDDVTTTQSTLNSIIKTLKPLRPNHCWYLTLAEG